MTTLRPARNKSRLLPCLVWNRSSMHRIPSTAAFILGAVSAAPAERSPGPPPLMWLFSGRAGWLLRLNAARRVLSSLGDNQDTLAFSFSSFLLLERFTRDDCETLAALLNKAAVYVPKEKSVFRKCMHELWQSTQQCVCVRERVCVCVFINLMIIIPLTGLKLLTLLLQ